jgi:hypothetical protein
MIPFFRKIRKKMADDNKPIKYMRYAVGEIALVVIGILIALQINTWNEVRKARIVELDILRGIKQNILLDTIDLNDNMRVYKEMYKRDKGILRHIVDKKPLDSTLESNLIHVGFEIRTTLMLHRSYFDEANRRGLTIISNKTLRDSISRLYEFTYAHLLYSQNIDPKIEYISKYHDLLSRYIKISPGFNITISDEQYQSILNDETFNVEFMNAMNSVYSLSTFYDLIHEHTIAIVNQIDEELVRRE